MAGLLPAARGEVLLDGHELPPSVRERKRAEHRFEMMDTDNDGNVTAEEFQAGRQMRFDRKFGRAKRIFSRIDANGDGQVTRDESTTAWTNWFRRIDANNDHVVTLDEVKSYRQNRRANW